MKRINKKDLSLYIEKGYVKGHLLSNTTGYMWIYNKDKNISKTIKKEDWKNYKISGYEKGNKLNK